MKYRCFISVYKYKNNEFFVCCEDLLVLKKLRNWFQLLQIYEICFSYQLTRNIFEFMVALWNEHTEAFQHKLLACAGDPGIVVSSIDNSILSLKGNKLIVL